MKARMIFQCLAMVLFASNVWAGEWQDFEKNAFLQAKAEGKTVVLDFYADWCSTCVTERPFLESLLKKGDFKKVVGFMVDYDASAKLKKDLRVISQATLIVFKGDKEVGRKIGLVGEDHITSLIRKGI